MEDRSKQAVRPVGDDPLKQDKSDPQFEMAKWYYEMHAIRMFEGSHDHGQAVIKNAFLLAGGALLAVPPLAQVFGDEGAGYLTLLAGACFAAALIFSMLGNYAVHLNWRSAALTADIQFRLKLSEYFPDHQDRFLIGPNDQQASQETLQRQTQITRRTQILPHALVVLYLLAMLGGMVCFYLEFQTN